MRPDVSNTEPWQGHCQPWIRAFIAERHAAEMGAVAENDQPLRLALLDARRVGLRIGQRGEVHVLGFLDLLRACDDGRRSACRARTASRSALRRPGRGRNRPERPRRWSRRPGFIWLTKGQSVGAAPTAPTAPVAMKRKSRRVGSARTAVLSPRVSSSNLRSPRQVRGRASDRSVWFVPADMRGNSKGSQCDRESPRGGVFRTGRMPCL